MVARGSAFADFENDLAAFVNFVRSTYAHPTGRIQPVFPRFRFAITPVRFFQIAVFSIALNCSEGATERFIDSPGNLYKVLYQFPINLHIRVVEIR